MHRPSEQLPSVIFRLSHMGDVALTTGVLNHWYETTHSSFIFITRTMHTPLLENHPAVKQIIALNDSDLSGQAWLRKAKELASEFSNHPLIDLHGTLRSQILRAFWKGPYVHYPKLGFIRRLYDRTHAESLRHILEKTNVPQRYALACDPTPPAAHKVIPRIYISESERVKAKSRLDHLQSEKPLIALHPYATHPSKQWPRQHWETLTDRLTKADYNWMILGRHETPLFQEHQNDLTNQTDLRLTCALLNEASLLITADSGPMHLASGVDTPILALFGPTVKAWGFFPAGKHDQVLERSLPCRPCSLHGGKTCSLQHKCLAKISPQEVLSATQGILNQIGASSPTDSENNL